MNTKKKLFIIIDAHALIHRAFHALPPLTAKDGRSVGAVYGVAATLLKILNEMQPEYLAAAFDREEPTFRHEAFRAYKATRPETPVDLVSQFAIIRELFSALGISVLDKAGYEADDIIGSLVAAQSKESFLEIVILTGDLDTLQLVGPRVKVCTFKRGMSEVQLYDEKAVRERYGIPPRELPDFKGLVGDPSDNIPGVKGIGEKTASALIKEYHTIEKIYENLEKLAVGPKVKKAFEEQHDAALFSKKLSTIDTHLELAVAPNTFRWRERYREDEALAFLKTLGFYSLVNRLPAGETAENISQGKALMARGSGQKTPFPEAKSLRAFLEFLSAIPPRNAISLWHAKKEERIFVSSGERTLSFPVSYLTPEACNVLFGENAPESVGYDFKELFRKVAYFDIPTTSHWFDVMIAAYLLHPGLKTYAMERIIFDELGASLNSEDPSSLLAVFPKLLHSLKEKIHQEGLDTVMYEIEMPLIPVLAKMESQGIAIDAERLANLEKEFHTEAKKLEARIFKLAGLTFNINSPSQLREVLFEKLKLPIKKIKKTSTGALSTSFAGIAQLQEEYEIVGLISQYRELVKLTSTYAEALPPLINPKTGRLHTTFSQVATATGRLASSHPNLQNIPRRSVLGRKIRSCFVSPPGFTLVSFDYSQIELRLAAVFAGDETLLRLFQKRDDIHTFVAATLWRVSPKKVTPPMRETAKALNFGFLYGISLSRFARDAGVTISQAREFQKTYRLHFPQLIRYLETLREEARATEKAKTFFGRIRHLPEINAASHELRAQAERMAVNMPIQGSQADIIKKAMIAVSRDLAARRSRAELLLQIHDELLFEMEHGIVEAEVKRIKDLMEGVVSLAVPLPVSVKIARRWGDMV